MVKATKSKGINIIRRPRRNIKQDEKKLQLRQPLIKKEEDKSTMCQYLTLSNSENCIETKMEKPMLININQLQINQLKELEKLSLYENIIRCSQFEVIQQHEILELPESKIPKTLEIKFNIDFPSICVEGYLFTQIDITWDEFITSCKSTINGIASDNKISYKSCSDIIIDGKKLYCCDKCTSPNICGKTKTINDLKININSHIEFRYI